MKVTFFNQPWLVAQVPAGNAARPARQLRGPQPLQGHVARADDARPRRPAAARRPSRTTRRPRACPRRRSSRSCAATATRSPTSSSRCPARLRAARAPARPPRRADRRALRRPRGRPAPPGLRRAAAHPARPAAPPRAPARGARARPCLDGPLELTERWLTTQLPFALTGDQRAAIEQLTTDLASPRPMQRLLMGEVGSGKTVVALFALLRAVEHGRQAALMAPTETLAEQHFATLQALMPGEAVPAALLTGSTPAARRADVLGKLASGELSLVVGTHALIEDAGRLRPPRRGRRRRAAPLRRAPAHGAGPQGGRRACVPHVLHMTATPIPRTLALLGYGDLDVTALRELPRGRRPISTLRRLGRARARAGLRAHPRGAARRAPGLRRLPARQRVRGAAGARRDGRVRAAGAPASCATSASSCCTARCARARRRRRWRASPPARPTCSSPRP